MRSAVGDDELQRRETDCPEDDAVLEVVGNVKRRLWSVDSSSVISWSSRRFLNSGTGTTSMTISAVWRDEYWTCWMYGKSLLTMTLSSTLTSREMEMTIEMNIGMIYWLLSVSSIIRITLLIVCVTAPTNHICQ